ncbi:MAG: class I SAM-dependent RNA methyltransferase [Planctomycetes bacterium]|nr:class I SAM-dependent RNA methyltransferase [Planctomycetota bacterium]
MEQTNDSAPPVELGQHLELDVERLAFGGSAIARHHGQVVFVPFAAPGDRVRVEIVAIEKTFLRGSIVELLQKGPDRVEPRCKHFGDCGGCQFQHVGYEAQVAAKAEFVRDALVRTGRFDWPQPVVVHHAEPWGYRSRTQLKLTATSGQRLDGRDGRLRKKERKLLAEQAAEQAHREQRPPQLGFHRAFSHSVVDLEQCPVLAPELEQGLPEVRRAIQGLPKKQWPYQIEGAVGVGAASWAPDLPGMRKDLVEHEVLGFRYLIEPESFFQQNRHLVQKLVEGALGDERGGLAFDLYAGVGLFTLPLSKRFERVVSVEDERRAATLGRVNVKSNGCDNVHYLRKTTEQFLDANTEQPDLVLMDPPRLGAKPALGRLLKLRPRRLVYVSCDPVTLARDLRTLVDGGYRLEQVEAFDMFPHTHHVEAVARLSLVEP